MMLPKREEALKELELANELNPGPWSEHSKNVAKACELIAKACNMDSEKAYILGLLHDIGRRTGVAKMRHVVDGYDYCMLKGWDEAAKICMTHSYPVKDVKTDLAPIDISEEQYKFLTKYIEDIQYDDYDKLVILCDSLALPNCFCILEKRFVDTSRRYGIFPFSLDRWNNTFEMKEYFDKLAGTDIYKLLPGIEECLYN